MQQISENAMFCLHNSIMMFLGVIPSPPPSPHLEFGFVQESFTAVESTDSYQVEVAFFSGRAALGGFPIFLEYTAGTASEKFTYLNPGAQYLSVHHWIRIQQKNFATSIGFS